MPGIGTRFGTRGISIGPHRGRSTPTTEFSAPTGRTVASLDPRHRRHVGGPHEPMSQAGRPKSPGPLGRGTGGVRRGYGRNRRSRHRDRRDDQDKGTPMAPAACGGDVAVVDFSTVVVVYASSPDRVPTPVGAHNRSWPLTRGFALHPGTRNRDKIRYTRTQHRPPSRQVNDHGRVSGTHTLRRRLGRAWSPWRAMEASTDLLDTVWPSRRSWACTRGEP